MYAKKELHDIRRKLKIFAEAKACGNVSFTCRRYGISRETFYTWKRRYESLGERGLINNKPCPQNLVRRVKREIEEKILYLRTTYHFGQQSDRLVSTTLSRHKNFNWRSKRRTYT